MFDLIINPLITVLTLLYGVLGENIVLAIAVLTIVIRLATSPLLISQQRSTKAMQELQPKLNAIKEKYKNDREKLAQAQMELMKQEGVNPLGGCLPLFVQLPILLGLYQAIIHGLAGTPFQLIDISQRLLIPSLNQYVPLNNMWIGMDLTLPPTTNPTYALAFPVLVMATTWLQSKLTMPAPAPPKEGEAPNQAAQMTKTMTTIMPLMFGFFSLSFSVGLSIYFVVGNIVGVIQYTLMGRAEWSNLLGGASTKETVSETAKASTTVVSGKKAAAVESSSQSNQSTGTTTNGRSGRKSKKDKKMRRAPEKSG